MEFNTVMKYYTVWLANKEDTIFKSAPLILSYCHYKDGDILLPIVQITMEKESIYHPNPGENQKHPILTMSKVWGEMGPSTEIVYDIKTIEDVTTTIRVGEGGPGEMILGDTLYELLVQLQLYYNRGKLYEQHDGQLCEPRVPWDEVLEALNRGTTNQECYEVYQKWVRMLDHTIIEEEE